MLKPNREFRKQRPALGAMGRRYSITISGRILSALMQTAVVAFVARSFGVSDFGVYAIVTSSCLLAMAGFDLGLGTRVLRLGADPNRAQILGTLGVLRAIAVFLVLAAVTIWAAVARNDLLLLCVVTDIYVTGESLGDLAVGILQGELRSFQASGVLLLRRSVALLPFVQGIDSRSAYMGLALAGVVGHLALWILLLRRAGRPMSAIALVRSNLAIIVSSGAANLFQADSLVLGLSASPGLVGLYAAGARLSNPVNMIISTLVQVLLPEMAAERNLGARLKVFRRAQRLVVVFAGLVAATAALAPLVVTVIFGPEFIAAAPVVGGVLVAAGLSAIAQVHLSWFYASRVPRYVAVGMVLAVILGLAMLGVLGHLVGTWGCAIALVAMQTIIMLVITVGWFRETRQLRNSVS